MSDFSPPLGNAGYRQRLIYDLYGAGLSGDQRHAQTAMRELGITYQAAIPISVGDQWQFWNCEGVPVYLPDYINSSPYDPFDMVGYGLSQSDAGKIAQYVPKP